MLNSVFLKDKYLNLVLPEFSTEAGRVSREKEPRESVDRNFEVLKSLGAEEILGVIEHRQAVKVEERTEPPAAPAETSTVRWSLGEKVAREERLNRLTQLRFLQVDKHEVYREDLPVVAAPLCPPQDYCPRTCPPPTWTR